MTQPKPARPGLRGRGTIEERAGTWWIQRSIQVEGRRRKFREGPFDSHEMAEAARATRRTAPTNNDALTVREVVNAWMAERTIELRRARKEATLAIFDRATRLHVLPSIGSMRIRAVTPADLTGLWTDWESKGLSRKTISNFRNVLSQVFDNAVVKGILFSNPVKLAALPAVHGGERDTATQIDVTERLWHLDDWRSVIWWASRTIQAGPRAVGHRWAGPLLLIATTGCRRGESLAVRWSNVDLDAGTLLIEDQAVLVDGEEHIRAPKTRSSVRTVALTPITVEALRTLRALLPSEPKKNDLVWPALGSKDRAAPRNVESFSQWWRHHGRGLADMPPSASLHGLRHTVASITLSAGNTDFAVAAALGHADVNTTKVVYGRSVKEITGRQVAATLDTVLNAVPAPKPPKKQRKLRAV